MSRHTPGPWVIHSDGETIFSKEPFHRVANCTTKSVGLYQNERRANARLIAAAPDLLDALTALVAGVERDDNPKTEGHFIAVAEMQVARAAIAKAEGL